MALPHPLGDSNVAHSDMLTLWDQLTESPPRKIALVLLQPGLGNPDQYVTAFLIALALQAVECKSLAWVDKFIFSYL